MNNYKKNVDKCPHTEECRLFGESKVCAGAYSIDDFENVLGKRKIGGVHNIICASQSKIVELEKMEVID